MERAKYLKERIRFRIRMIAGSVSNIQNAELRESITDMLRLLDDEIDKITENDLKTTPQDSEYYVKPPENV